SPTLPEEGWLKPTVQATLHEAVQVLQDLVTDFRSWQQSLREVFTDDVLKLDLAGLHKRFTEVHRGLGKLRRSYREDKRKLAACTLSGKVDSQVRNNLADAVRWKEVADRLATAETRHAD